MVDAIAVVHVGKLCAHQQYQESLPLLIVMDCARVVISCLIEDLFEFLFVVDVRLARGSDLLSGAPVLEDLWSCVKVNHFQIQIQSF